MRNTDKRDRLSEDVFTYRLTKDAKVLLYWKGKPVTTLAGKAGEKFMKAIAGKGHLDAQLVMAKATGNFKHGNEKDHRSES
ncbi:hypothetical protein SAMN02799624_00838 [Paenibacillus sp. UNC496MF]|uniref:hypothetical protein n=1 Tax=Paenibacillus sp. UNC496MF TaxID=1502753 RepID=UPI0008F45791|nr:hypothetical protein [Paenibacillus sp. UNC496MF]SFI40233.1 hypothetical protein SAMN02799624_00838 [Paenibacillus sp. UNC496MF]